MPQLDPASFPTQLFWLAISFIALYVLMARVALPKVGAIVDARAARIEGDLDRAQAAKAEADSIAKAYEKAIADARHEANGIIRAAEQAIFAKLAEREAESARALAEQTKGAEERIQAARAAALSALNIVAVEVAGAATARLIGITPDESVVAAAVESAAWEN